MQVGGVPSSWQCQEPFGGLGGGEHVEQEYREVGRQRQPWWHWPRGEEEMEREVSSNTVGRQEQEVSSGSERSVLGPKQRSSEPEEQASPDRWVQT